MYHAGARGLPVGRVSHVTMNCADPPKMEIDSATDLKQPRARLVFFGAQCNSAVLAVLFTHEANRNSA